MSEFWRILLCRCAHADVLPAETRDRVLAALPETPETLVVDDLCGCAAERDPRLARPAPRGPLFVLACHPRAARGLLRAAGVDLEGRDVRFLNLRLQPPEDIVAALGDASSAQGHGAHAYAAPSAGPPAWPPWFPVIDFGRCRNCGQCLNFCLFGVYARDTAGRVAVAQPKQCKNHCPACARICPEAAIIFPKAKESPIDGGEIVDEDAVRAHIKVNVEQILGNDVYAALAERRRRTRRRLLKVQDSALAEAERSRHLPAKE